MTLVRSLKGKHAKAIFFTQFNDVDIFVEDDSSGSEKFYKEIFSRVFGGIYRIESVFSLGGKSAVLQECQKYQGNGERKRIYIIDGDLDLLTDSNPKGLNGLYTLKRYCIENYLIDENAIIELLDEEDIERDSKQIKSDLNFVDWIKKNENDLFDLFVLYALLKEINTTLVTVGHKVDDLLSNNEGTVDSNKVTNRKKILEIELLNIFTKDELIMRKQNIVDRIILSERNKIDYISGKNYLFPLLIKKIKKINKRFQSSNKTIRQRLAKKCDISELRDCVHFLSN